MSAQSRRLGAAHGATVLVAVAFLVSHGATSGSGQERPATDEAAGELVDYVAATVNASPITWSALALERRLRDLSREEALDALIDRRLFLEEAATFIIVSDADVDRGIAELEAAGGSTWQQYAHRLMLEGISESELRDRIREQLMLDQLIARLFRPEIEPVTAADVEAYYREHADDLRTPARYRTERIHLSLPSLATEAAKRATRSRAARIRRDLVEGRTPGAELSRDLSTDPSVSLRADAIWRAADEHARELAAVVPLLAPGQWSEPVSTPLGFSLIRTVGVQPPQTPELHERLQHDITGLIEASRLGPVLDAWLEERRAESDIRTMQDVTVGEGDSG